MNEQPQVRIQDDLKQAMRSRDKERVSTLRLLLAEIKNEKIRAGQEVDETTFLGLVQKGIKQRREAAQQYREGEREELAAKEEREAEILTGYLPEQLSPDEVRAAVEELVAQQGLSGAKDLGKVMGALVPRFKGRIDGRELQQIARQVLG